MERFFKKYVFKLLPGLEGKYSKFLRFLFRFSSIRPSKNGIKVLNQDWDYLIVLDACRYDYFVKCNKIEGTLYKVNSCGSCTEEWIYNNFSNEYCDDIVYINANPLVSSILKKTFRYIPFYRIEDVWKDKWNESLGTVLPHDVTDSALLCLKKYPQKRMIIHYMQPHEPFIIDPKLKRLRFINTRDEQVNKRIRKGYTGNLVLVLDEVEKLLNYLEGKIVITSDHGDMFGKYFISGHPIGVYFKELINIPWLSIEKTGRKELDHKMITSKSIKKLKNKKLNL